MKARNCWVQKKEKKKKIVRSHTEIPKKYINHVTSSDKVLNNTIRLSRHE